jgi:hypothetical protein
MLVKLARGASIFALFSSLLAVASPIFCNAVSPTLRFQSLKPDFFVAAGGLPVPLELPYSFGCPSGAGAALNGGGGGCADDVEPRFFSMLAASDVAAKISQTDGFSLATSFVEHCCSLAARNTELLYNRSHAAIGIAQSEQSSRHDFFRLTPLVAQRTLLQVALGTISSSCST